MATPKTRGMRLYYAAHRYVSRYQRRTSSLLTGSVGSTWEHAPLDGSIRVGLAVPLRLFALVSWFPALRSTSSRHWPTRRPTPATPPSVRNTLLVVERNTFLADRIWQRRMPALGAVSSAWQTKSSVAMYDSVLMAIPDRYSSTVLSEDAPTENLVGASACRMVLDVPVRTNGPNGGLASFGGSFSRRERTESLSVSPCRLGSLARTQNDVR